MKIKITKKETWLLIASIILSAVYYFCFKVPFDELREGFGGIEEVPDILQYILIANNFWFIVLPLFEGAVIFISRKSHFIKSRMVMISCILFFIWVLIGFIVSSYLPIYHVPPILI